MFFLLWQNVNINIYIPLRPNVSTTFHFLSPIFRTLSPFDSHPSPITYLYILICYILKYNVQRIKYVENMLCLCISFSPIFIYFLFCLKCKYSIFIYCLFRRKCKHYLSLFIANIPTYSPFDSPPSPIPSIFSSVPIYYEVFSSAHHI